MYLPSLRLHGQQVEAGGYGGHRLQRIAGLAVPEDVHLTCKIGIAHLQPHHKAVQLRLRQQLRTGRAYRVLGGNDHEGVGQLVSLAVHGQQQVGHDRAGLIDEAAALLMVHRKAHDIRGQHIRRELEAPVLQTQRTAEGQRGGGLSGAGHVVQQHMAAGEHRHHDLFQHIVLTGDDLFHFMQDLFYAGIHLLFSSYHSL